MTSSATPWVTPAKTMFFRGTGMVLANVISVLASVFLLRRILMLSSEVRQRLFPRQMINLAVADITFHLGGLSVRSVPFFLIASTQGDGFCMWTSFVFRFGCFVSVAVQAHIAVGLACQAFRHFSAVPYLQRSLNVVWLLGLLLTCCEEWLQLLPFWSGHRGPDALYNHTFSQCQYQEPATAHVCFIGLCFTVSLGCYTAMCVRACTHHAPGSVMRKTIVRALGLPLVFIGSYGPHTLLLLRPDFYHTHGHFASLALMLQYLNGFLNAMVYLVQSRYLKKESRNRPRRKAPSRLSARVEFAGAEIVDIFDISTEASERAERETHDMEMQSRQSQEGGTSPTHDQAERRLEMQARISALLASCDSDLPRSPVSSVKRP